ncbi:MAG: membrane dipeptidase [Alphaproteobacteria bacterium]|nr:membrane dipeptidase [Alphaproteobacteria bacterium]MBV9372442.1 membrane dipeptidase [Alphaproteobacteria bacterium]MBV9902117.1 membrane dipeptidase [Alphaproteobacteria bacterium]
MTELDRRGFIAAGAGAALGAAAPAPRRGPRLVVNALGGLTDPNVWSDADRSNAVGPTERRTLTPRILRDALASGLDAVNVTLGYVAGPGDPFEQTVREIGIWDWRLRRHTGVLMQVLTAGDLLRAQAERKIGIVYGVQNAAMLGDKVERVDLFADLGLRVVQLTYNPANGLGDGAAAPQGRGLTPFGREVVERLNANRLMVDLSHSGERTCLDAARFSARPVSINHTGCRALNDLPRNKTDEELRLVASKGGFVGIYFMPFLARSGQARAEDVVRHIEHALGVCGEDHVGVGTDGGTTGIDDLAAYRAHIAKQVADRRQAGIGAAGENAQTLPLVLDLTGPTQFERLALMLARRGHPERRIDKILGLNFLAFAREIWG